MQSSDIANIVRECIDDLFFFQAVDGIRFGRVTGVQTCALPIFAVELADGATALHDADLGGDICLAFGNEERGCSAALLEAAELVVYIPQPGRVGSLNVSAAAAIALAEARRAEWAGYRAGGAPEAGDAG